MCVEYLREVVYWYYWFAVHKSGRDIRRENIRSPQERYVHVCIYFIITETGYTKFTTKFVIPSAQKLVWIIFQDATIDKKLFRLDDYSI